MAPSSQSLLFGKCKVTDYQCFVGESTVAWENSIILSCPFKKISTLSGFKLHNDYILYNKENHIALNLQIDDGYISSTSICDRSNIGKPIEVILTSEGFYVSGQSWASKLESSKLDESVIKELTLSEEDGLRYSELMDNNELKARMCENRVSFLRNMAWFDDIYEYLPHPDESRTVFYVKNGIIAFPYCIPISEIEIQTNNHSCTQDILVSFWSGNKYYYGYLLT